MALRRTQRAAIVIGYAIGYWAVLPAALWALARWGDARWGYRLSPQWVGWPVLAAGAALLGWAWVELWRGAGGLPVSALPPPRLTTAGPYRHVRHPNYLGFNLGVLGVGLAVGSPTLAWIVAPGFLPLWIAYAKVEERGLCRRFGIAYASYRRRVGLLPRFPVYPLLQLAMRRQALPFEVLGAEHLPRAGAAVLISNHASYVDFLYVGATTGRQVRFVTTAEIFRNPFARWLLSRVGAIPLARYRFDVVAVREILSTLQAGELVGLFPEGERAPLGRLQPPLPEAARLLARLPCPVIPVGISGSYDVGPRWADRLRRRPVTVRVGPPIDFGRGDPATRIARSIRALVSLDPQPVHLDGLPRDRLSRVLWSCPRCRDERRWSAETLRCDACGAHWRPRGDGWLVDEAGARRSLADVARPLWDEPGDAPLCTRADGFTEPATRRADRPLSPLGQDVLEVGPRALRFGALEIAVARITRVSTERADTLQVATLEGMWQFRPHGHSAFRLCLALQRHVRRAGTAREAAA